MCRPQRGDRGDRPPRRFDGPPGGGGGYRESRFGSREGGGGFGRGGGDKVSITLLHQHRLQSLLHSSTPLVALPCVASCMSSILAMMTVTYFGHSCPLFSHLGEG